jgi:holo-[acyl-carrier protein] synthase
MIRCGIDMIEIERVDRGIARLGERFLNRFFTPRERADCEDKPYRLAARLAAKEAVAKALGTGIGEVGWKEIEIRGNNERNRPTLFLHGQRLTQQIWDGAVGREPHSRRITPPLLRWLIRGGRYISQERGNDAMGVLCGCVRAVWPRGHLSERLSAHRRGEHVYGEAMRMARSPLASYRRTGWTVGSWSGFTWRRCISSVRCSPRASRCPEKLMSSTTFPVYNETRKWLD